MIVSSPLFRVSILLMASEEKKIDREEKKGEKNEEKKKEHPAKIRWGELIDWFRFYKL